MLETRNAAIHLRWTSKVHISLKKSGLVRTRRGEAEKADRRKDLQNSDIMEEKWRRGRPLRLYKRMKER